MADIDELTNPIRDQQHTEDFWKKARFQNQVSKGKEPDAIRYLGDKDSIFV